MFEDGEADKRQNKCLRATVRKIKQRVGVRGLPRLLPGLRIAGLRAARLQAAQSRAPPW